MRPTTSMACIALMIVLGSSSLLHGSPDVIFGAGHLPTSIGIKGTWYTNTNDSPWPVTISFTPPWDFTNGPTQRKYISSIIDKSQAYKASDYPGAAYASTDNSSDRVYTFLKKMNSGSYMYGQSSPDNEGINMRISPPWRGLPFPLTVGRSVTQNTTIYSSSGTTPLTIKMKVIAKGAVTVGAGTFNDAVMVQIKFSFGGAQPRTQIWYQWFVPYVGMVVHIMSVDNEPNEHFTTARMYRWLQTLSVP